jgi:hypothetical protein
MAASSGETWRDMFTNWPAAIPKRGVIVSTLNEPVPFKSFFLKGDTVLLERTNPDTLGARFVVMAYESIHMVKLIDPIKESVFNQAGYAGQLAKN